MAYWNNNLDFWRGIWCKWLYAHQEYSYCLAESRYVEGVKYLGFSSWTQSFNHGLKSRHQHRYRPIVSSTNIAISVININNIDPITNISSDIRRFYKVDIVSRTSKTDTIYCRYISESTDTWDHAFNDALLQKLLAEEYTDSEDEEILLWKGMGWERLLRKQLRWSVNKSYCDWSNCTHHKSILIKKKNSIFTIQQFLLKISGICHL